MYSCEYTLIFNCLYDRTSWVVLHFSSFVLWPFGIYSDQRFDSMFYAGQPGCRTLNSLKFGIPKELLTKQRQLISPPMLIRLCQTHWGGGSSNPPFRMTRLESGLCVALETGWEHPVDECPSRAREMGCAADSWLLSGYTPMTSVEF